MPNSGLHRNPTLRWVASEDDHSYYFLPHLPSAGRAQDSLRRALDTRPQPRTRVGWRRRLQGLDDPDGRLLDALSESAVLVEDKTNEGLLNAFRKTPPIADITLMLTSDCNLRCRYCYAEGGRKAESMPRSLIDHSLTYFWQERFRGGETASLSFHGGGEPTLEFRNMEYAMERFSIQAESRGVRPYFSVTTNGTFGAGARRVLSRYRAGITLSWDGPPEIQHSQRPAATGRSYADRLAENLQWARAEGLSVSIRATVTQASLPHLEEIVAFFAGLGLDSASLEPCAVDGRAAATMAPDRIAFAEGCADVALAYLPKGFRVTSTFLAWGKFSPRFCGMTSKNCLVTSTGHLSSCYEALNPRSSRERPYLYGRIEPRKGVLTLDQERRARIASRSATDIAECGSCPFQLSCAGWCPYKVSRGGYDYAKGVDPDACAAIRAGTTRLIKGLVDGKWPNMKSVEISRQTDRR